MSRFDHALRWHPVTLSLAVVAASLLVVPCGAQTVQGVLVSQKSHLPIGNAHLALIDSAGRVAGETVSDSSIGAFYLTAATPGRYELKILIGRGGVSYSPFFTLDSNQVIERMFVAPDWPPAVLKAYLATDVTRVASPTAPFARPRFPDTMYFARRDGLVRARFVIDGEGRPDMNTFEAIESDDQSFTRSVRDAVSRSRFIPAEREGVPVPQVFDLAVDFAFADTPPRLSGTNVIVVRALGVTRRVSGTPNP